MAEARYLRRARTTEPIRQPSSPWFPVASTGPSKQGKGNVRAAVPAVGVVGLRLWRVA
jgi:hypothetical protein